MPGEYGERICFLIQQSRWFASHQQPLRAVQLMDWALEFKGSVATEVVIACLIRSVKSWIRKQSS